MNIITCTKGWENAWFGEPLHPGAENISAHLGDEQIQVIKRVIFQYYNSSNLTCINTQYNNK